MTVPPSSASLLNLTTALAAAARRPTSARPQALVEALLAAWPALNSAALFRRAGQQAARLAGAGAIELLPTTLPLDHTTLIGQAILGGQVQTEPAALPNRGLSVAVPLGEDGSASGVLYAHAADPQTLYGEGRAVLQIAAQVIALALESPPSPLASDDLLNRAQQSLGEIHAQYDSLRRIVLAGDATEMLQTLVDFVGPGCLSADLSRYEDPRMMRGEAPTEIRDLVRISGDDVYLPDLRLPFAHHVTRPLYDLIAGGVPLVIPNISEVAVLSEAQRATFTGRGIEALIVLPLVSERLNYGQVVLGGADADSLGLDRVRAYQALADQIATALENHALIQQAVSALTELRQLYGMADAILNARDPQAMVEQVYPNLTYPPDQLSLHHCEYDETGQINLVQALVTVGAAGRLPLDDDTAAGWDGLLRGALGDRLSHNDTPVFLTRDEASTGQAALQALALGALAAYPLRDADGLVRYILCAAYPDAHAFDEDERQMLATASRQMGQRLVNWQLLEDTRRKTIRLQEQYRITNSLYETGRALSGALEREMLVARAAENLYNALNVDQVTIVLFGEQGESFAVAAAYPDRGLEGSTIDLQDKTAFALLSNTRGPYTSEDVATDPRLDPIRPMLHARGVRSLMLVPLVVSDALIGCIALAVHEAQRSFSSDEINTSQAIAAQLAVSVQNAQLYDELELRVEQRTAELHHSEETERQFREGLTTVLEISAELSGAATLDDLFRQAVEAGRERIGIDRMAFFLFDDTLTEMIGTFGTTSDGKTSDERGERFSIPAELPIRDIQQTREHMIIRQDILLTDGTRQVVGTGWHAAMLLTDGRRPVGMMVADNLMSQQPLLPYQAEVLKLFGMVVGSLVTNRQVGDALRQSEAAERSFREGLSRLLEFSSDLARASNIDELYQGAVETGKWLLGFDRVALRLVDDTRTQMTGTFGIDRTGSVRDERGFSGPAPEALQLANPFTTLNRVKVWPDDDLTDQGEVVGQGWRAAALVMDGNTLLGWLEVDNLLSQRPLEGYQIEILRLFGTIIGGLIASMRSEQAMDDQRAFLRQVIDANPSLVFAKDYDGHFTLVNQAMAEVYGTTVEAMLGKTDADFNPNAAEVAAFLHDDRAVMDNNMPLFIPEEPLSDPDTGEAIWLQTIKVPLVGADGRSRQVLGIATDITERRQAQEALRQSEQRLQAVLDNIPIRVFWKDQDLRYLGANKAFLHDAGLETQEQIIGKDDYDMPWGEQADLYRGDDRAVMDRDQPKLQIEEPQTRPDGSHGWLVTNKVPIHDTEGHVVAVLGTYEDITERVLLQRQIQESLVRRGREVETATDVAQEIAAAPALDELFRRVVTLIKERFGYYHAQVFRTDPATGDQYTVEGYGAAGEAMKAAGHRIKLGTGVVGTAASSKQPMLVADVAESPTWLPNPHLPHSRGELAVPILLRGEVVGVLDVQSETPGRLTTEDILLLQGLCGQIAIAIESTEAQQELRRLNSAVEQSYATIVVTDLKGNIEYVNQRFTEVTGYTAAEAIGSNTRMLRSGVHQPEFYKDMWDTILAGKTWHGELQNRKKDGSLYWEATTISPIRDSVGNLTAFLAVREDITERKRIEQQLAQERNLLRTLIDAIPDYIYVKDRQSRMLINNRAHAEGLFGAPSPEDVVGKTDFDFFPRELAEQYFSYEQTLMAQSEPLIDEEVPSQLPDGSVTWHLDTKVPLHDSKGDVIGLVGITRDITARKEAELESQRLLTELGRRTVQLQAAAQAARTASSSLDMAALLNETIELIRREFDLYYAGVFLLDGAGEYAELHAGTGEAGRKMREARHRLKVGGQSMIGTAIAQRQARVALDVKQEERFHPNPHLPLTRSEMALPLLSRGQVIGAMTIQSTRIAAFSEDDITTLQVMADQLANAIENARLFEQSQATLARTEALYRGGNRISRATTMQEVLMALIESTALGELDRIAMLLFDQPWDDDNPPTSLTVAAGWESSGELSPLPPGAAYPVAQYPLVRLLAGSQPVIAVDAGSDPRFGDDLRAYFAQTLQMRGLLALPLLVGSRSIGGLVAQARDELRISDDQVRQIVSLADQAAAVVQTQRLFSQAQTALAETRSLYQVGQAINRLGDLNAIFQTLTEVMNQQLGYAGAWIALVSDRGDTLQGVAGAGFPVNNNIISDSVPIEPRLAHPMVQAYLRGEVLVINDAANDRLTAGLPAAVRNQAGRLMTMPILVQGQSVGVITVTRPLETPELRQRDVDLLAAVASQAAIVFQNARLLAETQQRAAQEQELNRITGRMQEHLQISTLLNDVVNELGKTINARRARIRLTLPNQLDEAAQAMQRKFDTQPVGGGNGHNGPYPEDEEQQP